ncbi:MAG: radical SAM protein [Clostridioides sp.]|jgi:uncharacterized protein|nr:radical SAM protein [Clostridioides sp.]
MNKKPFIHTFEAGENYYLYDVNKDVILKVEKDVYDYLKQVENDKKINFNLEKDTKEKIDFLKRCGFLKSKRVKKTKHPSTDNLQYYIDEKLNSLILQVTQNCNLRCEYCIYSGTYKNRTHTNKRMSVELAIKAIDYLMEHSKQKNELGISFYGGEPLLEFELIKKVVEYSQKVGEGKDIYYNLTTNATLFNEDIIKFFVQNKITVMISLDRDKETHDKYRKFNGNNRSTHEIVLKNAEYIKSKYPEYFKEHISFNCVVNTESDYGAISDFISTNKIIKDSSFLSSLINPNYCDNKETKVSKEYLFHKNYERFLILLSKLGFVDEKKLSPLTFIESGLLEDFRDEKNLVERIELPDECHHG